MALPSAYLITTKNLEALLNALRSAKAPERFNNKFLTQLDFSSSNDRLFIGVFKALGLIDESGSPTQHYFQFLDQTQSGRVLADALKDTYADLFAVNTKAQDMSVEEIKNKFKTLTQGQKSDNVVAMMTSTFKALADQADWEAPAIASNIHVTETPSQQPDSPSSTPESPSTHGKGFSLHYNIQIHLPESRDPAVFDAIFNALRRHLN
ncbi:MAG: DUF5343 domain-containing protein [Terracidiphilus sp.]|nr:DUF5343 domain-containing protein [Terracidiphilus sp.]